MKSQQSITNLAYISQTETKNKYITCSEGNNSALVCMRQKCESPAFICIAKDCNCKEAHKTCRLKSTVDCIQQILQDKIKPLKQIAQMIQKQIQSTIDELSKFQVKIRLDIQNSPTYNGFTEAQNLFINSIRSGQVRQTKGKHIYQIQQIFIQSIKNPYQKIQQNITQSWNRFKGQIQFLKQSIDDVLFNKNITKVSYFKDSNIIKNCGDQQKMVKFFDKKIIKIQLLYRGTRDSFKVAKFHQKCDNIPNTLTIIQTTKNNIFGGYTQLIWTSQPNYQYIGDNKIESFIFQLNQNHKFKLKKSQHAIRRDILYGPTFGKGQDIIIKDDANINDNSSANIGTSYQNDSYVKGDANSWEKFSGGLKFTIKQYQVWQITFV